MTRRPGHGIAGGLMAALLGLLLATTALTGAPQPVLAAEPYTMETAATYVVDPTAGTVAVTVNVTFTNTTPNPAGRYSLYRSVPIALQDGAGALTARDAGGALTAALTSGSGGTQATVTLRTPLRYRKSASFSVAYQLANGASGQVRVGPSAVMVPIWSYGTSGTVRVELPSGYTLATRGSPLAQETAANGTVLTSGAIDHPASWLALLTATQPGAYATLTRSVPLSGGTMDLQVRAWNDDPEWATRTLDLLSGALPVLQEEIGLPYTGVGPMVVTESLPAGSEQFAEPTPGAQEIAVSYQAVPFTVIHQAAHIWLGAALIADSWIREGLASQMAARAAQQLGVALPFDPARQANQLARAAIPLASWDGTSSATTDAAVNTWAYAASWDLANRIAGVVGQDGLQQVLLRAQEGVGAYQPAAQATVPGAAATTPLPLDSRRFLDQLEQVSGRDLDSVFAGEVFPASDAAALASRTAARLDYVALASAAGDWGVPDTVSSLMAGWHFDDAQQAMTAALAWLRQRDGFIAEVSAAGLATPGRLRDLWRADGGDARAAGELTAETALLTAYRQAVDQIGEPNPVERLGLLGAATPHQLLDTAAGLFADGDLAGAADSISRAVTADRDAQAAGVVRLAIILAALAVLAAAVTLVRRRLRRDPAQAVDGAGTRGTLPGR